MVSSWLSSSGSITICNRFAQEKPECRAARVPLLAIGGINTVRVAEVIAAGCAGVAVMGGVMRAADPGLEVGALVATLQGIYPRAR